MESKIGGKGLWEPVSALIADTTGKRSGRTSPPVSSTASALRPVRLTIWKEMMTMSKRWSCEECIHSMQKIADDVACCNCCENGSFFEQYKDEYTLADLGHNWW